MFFFCFFLNKGFIQSITRAFIKAVRFQDISADICVCSHKYQFILEVTPAPEMEVHLIQEAKKSVVLGICQKLDRKAVKNTSKTKLELGVMHLLMPDNYSGLINFNRS